MPYIYIYISKIPHLHQSSNIYIYIIYINKVGKKKKKKEKGLELMNSTMEQEDIEVSSKESCKNPAEKKKKNGENSCKRFSDGQVKLLESVFSQATKLEPKKKAQLAKDIGLHPRQVSIWFQNKRARWRSKQMESEYRVLKDDFDALNQQFESLKKENESLLEQIQTLRSLYEKRHGEQSSISKNSHENGGYRDSAEIRNNKGSDDEEGSWGLWSEEENEEAGVVEKYLRENHEKEKQEIIEFLRMQSTDHEYATSSSLASPADKKWCDLPVPVPSVQDGFLDESCSPSSWWN